MTRDLFPVRYVGDGDMIPDFPVGDVIPEELPEAPGSDDRDSDFLDDWERL